MQHVTVVSEQHEIYSINKTSNAQLSSTTGQVILYQLRRMGTRPMSQFSTKNLTNVGQMEFPNLIFDVLNKASLMDPLPPSEKKLMHTLSVPQNNFTSKRSMADVRREKINLSTAGQPLKKKVSNKVYIRRPNPAIHDGEIQRTVPIIEEFDFVRRRSNYRPFRTDPAKCYCNRPQTQVWCLMCGYITKGNVKVTCPQHPNNKNDYEILVCPNPKCGAPNHLNEVDTKRN